MANANILISYLFLNKKERFILLKVADMKCLDKVLIMTFILMNYCASFRRCDMNLMIQYGKKQFQKTYEERYQFSFIISAFSTLSCQLIPIKFIIHETQTSFFYLPTPYPHHKKKHTLIYMRDHVLVFLSIEIINGCVDISVIRHAEISRDTFILPLVFLSTAKDKVSMCRQ